MENIGTEYGFCAHTANIWQFVGTCLMVFKVVIPAILIIIGIFTLGKAVISDDEKDIKNGFNKLIKKFIVAICIFFIPNIISSLFGIVNGFQEVRDDFNVCKKCITNPNNSDCINNITFEDVDA